MSYTHFTYEDRVELSRRLRQKEKRKDIAKVLQKPPRSVRREIATNQDDDGVYRAHTAQKKYLARRKKAKEQARKIYTNTSLQEHIKKRLSERDSPEQIAGRLAQENADITVSHETIYQWIFSEKPELKKHLRRIGRKGKYRRKRGTKQREKAREEAKVKRIDTRPEEATTRARLGDWEGDTVIGSDKKTRFLTNVDRKSGYGLISLMTVVTAEESHHELERRFRRIPKNKRHTYTYDNGTEIGKEDALLEKKIGMEVYRAYPYHSWERPCNEHFNGLIRDFFPKGTDFSRLSVSDIRKLEKNLNNRPRKRLGYRTPHEVFVLGWEGGVTSD
jgi:transposase, IS30 family